MPPTLKRSAAAITACAAAAPAGKPDESGADNAENAENAEGLRNDGNAETEVSKVMEQDLAPDAVLDCKKEPDDAGMEDAGEAGDGESDDADLLASDAEPLTDEGAKEKVASRTDEKAGAEGGPKKKARADSTEEATPAAEPGNKTSKKAGATRPVKPPAKKARADSTEEATPATKTAKAPRKNSKAQKQEASPVSLLRFGFVPAPSPSA